MTITKRTDYAVRIMYELAQLPTAATLSVRDLCEAADVPDAFGAALVPFLIAAGMIRAEGHRDHLLSLARPATEMTMAEIVRACEPEFSLSQCTRDPNSCDRSARCGVHLMWAGLDQIIWQQLEELTLARVATGHGLSCPVPDRRRAIDFTSLLGIA